VLDFEAGEHRAQQRIEREPPPPLKKHKRTGILFQPRAHPRTDRNRKLVSDEWSVLEEKEEACQSQGDW
jgi:hypothetical protein